MIKPHSFAIFICPLIFIPCFSPDGRFLAATATAPKMGFNRRIAANPLACLGSPAGVHEQEGLRGLIWNKAGLAARSGLCWR